MSIITSSGESIELDITDPEIVTHIEDEKSCAKIIMRQINTERIYDKFLKDKKNMTILLGENGLNQLMVNISKILPLFLESRSVKLLDLMKKTLN